MEIKDRIAKLGKVFKEMQITNVDGTQIIYVVVSFPQNWLIDEDKIVGSGSIRLNPEINKKWEIYAGHIFYQIVPTYRNQGYGKLICHLLLEEMKKLGFKEAIISCYDTNIGSINIIESNSGELIETVNGDGSENSDHLKTRRYKIDIDKSLLEYNTRNNLKK